VQRWNLTEKEGKIWSDAKGEKERERERGARVLRACISSACVARVSLYTHAADALACCEGKIELQRESPLARSGIF